MNDLYTMLLVSAAVGLIAPRWGWLTLLIGMSLTLMRSGT